MNVDEHELKCTMSSAALINLSNDSGTPRAKNSPFIIASRRGEKEDRGKFKNKDREKLIRLVLSTRHAAWHDRP